MPNDPANPRSEHAQAIRHALDAALTDHHPDRSQKVDPDDVPAQPVEQARKLLGLIGRWHVADPEPDLASKTIGSVLSADPTPICEGDGQALEIILDRRRQGLDCGPVPEGAQPSVARVSDILCIIDNIPSPPPPNGLAERTIRTIDRNRLEQRQRSVMSMGRFSHNGLGSFNLRQLATTAALLAMALSVLFPMLQKGKRDAGIAACSNNLAALGANLQSIATDYKQSSQPTVPMATSFKELRGFARQTIDGTSLPPSRARFYVLLKERRIDLQHTICPAADPTSTTGHYNGQNPIAGGPQRLFFSGSRPIYADTNPLYQVTSTGLIRDKNIPGLTRSQNHGGTGQNILYSDGSVKWTNQPTVFNTGLEQDNIWLWQPPTTHSRDADVFLTP